MRILLAEDDRDLNNAVKTLLTRSGYQVDAVLDGEEARDYVRAEADDGVILDWMMPRKDGVEALRQMRAEGIKTPCLLLTARDAVEDRVTGLDAGADDYLPKPFDVQELLARVRAMLRRREAFIPDVIQFEDLALDKGTGELRCGDRSVRLSGKNGQGMGLGRRGGDQRGLGEHFHPAQEAGGAGHPGGDSRSPRHGLLVGEKVTVQSKTELLPHGGLATPLRNPPDGFASRVFDAPGRQIRKERIFAPQK